MLEQAEQDTMDRTIGYCHHFNAGDCRRRRCSFIHQCFRCRSSEHSAKFCRVPAQQLSICPDFNQIEADRYDEAKRKAISGSKEEQRAFEEMRGCGGCEKTAGECERQHICAVCLKHAHPQSVCAGAEVGLSVKRQVREKGRLRHQHGTKREGMVGKAHKQTDTTPDKSIESPEEETSVAPAYSARATNELETTPPCLETPSGKPRSTTQSICRDWNKVTGCRNARCKKSHSCNYPLINSDTPTTNPVPLCTSSEHNALAHGGPLHFCTSYNSADGCLRESVTDCGLHLCIVCKKHHPRMHCPMTSLQQRQNICRQFNARGGCRFSDWECKHVHMCGGCGDVGHGISQCKLAGESMDFRSNVDVHVSLCEGEAEDIAPAETESPGTADDLDGRPWVLVPKSDRAQWYEADTSEFVAQSTTTTTTTVTQVVEVTDFTSADTVTKLSTEEGAVSADVREKNRIPFITKTDRPGSEISSVESVRGSTKDEDPEPVPCKTCDELTAVEPIAAPEQ